MSRASAPYLHAESGDVEHLRLATLEEARTVGLDNNPDLHRGGANVPGASTVKANPVVHDRSRITAFTTDRKARLAAVCVSPASRGGRAPRSLPRRLHLGAQPLLFVDDFAHRLELGAGEIRPGRTGSLVSSTSGHSTAGGSPWTRQLELEVDDLGDVGPSPPRGPAPQTLRPRRLAGSAMAISRIPSVVAARLDHDDIDARQKHSLATQPRARKRTARDRRASEWQSTPHP